MYRNRILRIYPPKLLVLSLTLGASFQCLAQTPEPVEVRRAEVAFEELPELKASEILKPELLKGPHHVVREPVPTASGMNQFTIDSDFGVFEADGNEMLLQRLKEIDAIARLREVSRTDEFKNSLVAAAKSPLNSAKNIARDPAQAISNVPKGIMKFLGRAKETVENVGKGGGEADGEGNRMKDAIGYSDKKRQIALQMGIDPYAPTPFCKSSSTMSRGLRGPVDSRLVPPPFQSVARSEPGSP
jgi:hypothetical protein